MALVIQCCVCHKRVDDLNEARWLDGLPWANWFQAGAVTRPGPRKVMGWAHIPCAEAIDAENAERGYPSTPPLTG